MYKDVNSDHVNYIRIFQLKTRSFHYLYTKVLIAYVDFSSKANKFVKYGVLVQLWLLPIVI